MSNDDYRSFFENSPVGFCRTTFADGRFLMANLSCAQLLGYSTVDELLQTKSILMYDDENARLEILDKLKENQNIYKHEVKIQKPDGSVVWIAITAHRISDYIEGFLEDITNEKELKEQISNIRQQEVDKLGEMQKGIKKRLKEISISMDGKRSS
jgi:PAS domain S-box-containing protein